MLSEGSFLRMLSLERKRTERSRKPLLLMLIGCAENAVHRGLHTLVPILFTAIRETDTTGWYKNGSVVGVMFTEISSHDTSSVVAILRTRIGNAIRERISPEHFNDLDISFHLFPKSEQCSVHPSFSDIAFYPELRHQNKSQRSMLFVKRLIDLVGSIGALVVLSPFFLLVAVAVRFTSGKPVLFHQHRVGQDGVLFDFLKFRSMHVNNDPAIHKEYVKRLVAGTAEKHATDRKDKAVYKLITDPRVTRLGAFLRRTSLDELPQFLNVLKGEMSLVGPRPPLPYEVEAYDLWHRRRLLEAKPGITGLWQVSGRNRMNFDQMVRLDLLYAKTWSPWLDLKILLRTPRAVLDGAH